MLLANFDLEATDLPSMRDHYDHDADDDDDDGS